MVIVVVLVWLIIIIIEWLICFGFLKCWKFIGLCMLMIGIVYFGGMMYVCGGFGFCKGYSLDVDVMIVKFGVGYEFVNVMCGVLFDE